LALRPLSAWRRSFPSRLSRRWRRSPPIRWRWPSLGLPHVLSELRYVDRRFGRRLPRRCWRRSPLCCASSSRRELAWCSARRRRARRAGGAWLGRVAAPSLRTRGVARKTVALSVGRARLAGATMIAPFTTSVAVAILHNFTPLGFLWQIAPRGARLRVMAAAAFGLLLLPLLAAMGAAHWAFDAGPSPFDRSAPGRWPNISASMCRDLSRRARGGIFSPRR